MRSVMHGYAQTGSGQLLGPLYWFSDGKHGVEVSHVRRRDPVRAGCHNRKLLTAAQFQGVPSGPASNSSAGTPSGNPDTVMRSESGGNCDCADQHDKNTEIRGTDFLHALFYAFPVVPEICSQTRLRFLHRAVLARNLLGGGCILRNEEPCLHNVPHLAA